MPNLIADYTGEEAKSLLNDIADIFHIGEKARTPSGILINVRNAANDEFCRHKAVIGFLEGKIFRFIKKPNRYFFTMPECGVDFFGDTIMEAVEKAIDYNER